MGHKSGKCSLLPLVCAYQENEPIDWTRHFKRRAALVVEIGFGMGEFLTRAAVTSPEINFVGIEQLWERIYKTLSLISRINRSRHPTLANIGILKCDARVALGRLFAPRSIEKVICLFPCPWPKKDHIKHRLFSNSFLKLLNSRLKSAGTVEIVTDYYPYVEWIGEQVESTGLKYQSSTVDPRYDTKFERKWRREGQKEFFAVKLTKVRHFPWPNPKRIELRTYTIKDFNFDNFDFKDHLGDVSVIFKEKIYDDKNKTAMVHLVVAEEALTQHLWVTIYKHKSDWKIKRSDGQNFFPTNGIAKALELVYQEAQTALVR